MSYRHSFLCLAAEQAHHGTSESVSGEHIGLRVVIVVVARVRRRLSTRTPESTRVHTGNRAGEFGMLLRIANLPKAGA